MDNLTWTTIEKAHWPKGPWLDEPDKEQFTDPATGLACLIKRQPRLGHLCGYVGVPIGHPLHGVTGDELDELAVHGGVTFTALCQDGNEAENICHIPGPGEPEPLWWIGFDAAHAFDRLPEMPELSRGEDTYKDWGYMKAECAILAAQVASYG
jgi:hypothetical protein